MRYFGTSLSVISNTNPTTTAPNPELQPYLTFLPCRSVPPNVNSDRLSLLILSAFLVKDPAIVAGIARLFVYSWSQEQVNPKEYGH